MRRRSRGAEPVVSIRYRWIMEVCRARQSARRAMNASGFDMDVGVVLFVVVLAIWMFAIWRDYDERHTHHKS